MQRVLATAHERASAAVGRPTAFPTTLQPVGNIRQTVRRNWTTADTIKASISGSSR